MKNNTIRNILNTGIAAFAASTIVLSPHLKKHDIPYTETDKTNNPIYLEELRKLEESYDIKFQNTELYQIVAEQLGENFTIEDLKNIKTLTIDGISNTDLSDLKYLTNLNELTIKNGAYDLSDLKYNSKLARLSICIASITNSQDLPNCIQLMELTGIEVKDNHLYMPYNIKALKMHKTLFSSFTLKNPNSLTELDYNSYGILDLVSLEECTNLTYLAINKSPNIKNPEVLAKLPSLKHIFLDNYAPIWLDIDTSQKLNYYDKKQKEEIEFLIDILDKLTKFIITPEMTDEEKIKIISLTVADLIEYDSRVEGQDDELAIIYNEDPITCALRDGKGVCMEYGCLFTALANRAGLDNYQDFSNNHTWNIITNGEEDICYDITNMDKPYAIIRGKDDLPYGDPEMSYLDYFENHAEELLYYYGFPEEKNTYQGLIPEQLPSEKYDIGYVPFHFKKTDIEKAEIRKETLKKILPIFALQIIGNIVLPLEEQKQKRKVK